MTLMLDPLAEKILQELKRLPGQKATELAQAANADRRDGYRCLAHTLAGKVSNPSVCGVCLAHKGRMPVSSMRNAFENCLHRVDQVMRLFALTGGKPC